MSGRKLHSLGENYLLFALLFGDLIFFGKEKLAEVAFLFREIGTLFRHDFAMFVADEILLPKSTTCVFCFSLEHISFVSDGLHFIY